MSLIECTDLTRTYRLGGEVVKALDGVSLRIDRGDFVAITGPSGSGKSTLANVIGGLDRPDSGSVIVDLMDLSTAKDAQLSAYRNSHIGFVFQSFNLQSHETALENVIAPLVIGGVGRTKERRRLAMAALTKVGLADRASHKPPQLSGGQRQRVAIARALVNNPAVVIADEPTGNLDTARGTEVMEELARLNRDQGITLIVITHDTRIAQWATRVLSIIDGRLSEQNGLGDPRR